MPHEEVLKTPCLLYKATKWTVLYTRPKKPRSRVTAGQAELRSLPAEMPYAPGKLRPKMQPFTGNDDVSI